MKTLGLLGGMTWHASAWAWAGWACSVPRSPSASRQRYLDAIDVLTDRGAEAVILGCTEIGMLVTPASHPLPQIDCIAAPGVCASMDTCNIAFRREPQR